ncbi:MAG: polysaccharide pyruvyl transferase family protein [Oscillospiraceae bacterium]|nr:polysaccharide pyruvyl transferase family protein [Oscillospiraceae bacterium]
MNILITGAQFANKGAQSMLFTVISKVRDRYPDAEFYYLPLDYFRKGCFDRCGEYRMHFVYDDLIMNDYPTRYGVIGKLKRRKDMNSAAEAMRGKNVLFLSEIWDRLDALIDISGYSLTSKFGISSINRIVRHINKAKSMGMSVIFMPQSYGPLNFGENTENVCRTIREALCKVDLLFAREKQGIDVLVNECGVKNAVLSPDTVLQAREIKTEHIFTGEHEVSVQRLDTAGAVGIIPNTETLKNGDRAFVLDCYRQIIGTLREKGREVFIFRHSEDLQLCRDIYALVSEDEHCHLIEDELDCLAYGEFVKQFDFVVASRFHSVVHAYKEGIPALVLGWAVKYQELTALFAQGDYAFDITKAESCDLDKMKDRLCSLCDNHARESQVIKDKLEDILRESCFDKCWEVLDKI